MRTRCRMGRRHRHTGSAPAISCPTVTGSSHWACTAWMKQSTEGHGATPGRA